MMFNQKSASLEVEAPTTENWDLNPILTIFDVFKAIFQLQNHCTIIKNYIFMIRKICSIDSNQLWTVLIFHQIFQILLQPIFP